MGNSDNLLLKIIKNCYNQKKCKNILQTENESKKSKIYTNIFFPNCDAILYVRVLSFQKYKNIDLQLDFLNY